MNFKVGDKVRIKEDLDCRKDYKVLITPSMEKYKGKICEIKKEVRQGVYILGIGSLPWHWSDDTFELVEEKKFTKSDLQDGDIVTLRNGLKYRKVGEKIRTSYAIISLDCFTENLKCLWQGQKNIDVIKVERPTRYEAVYERVEEDKKEILDETEREYLKAVIKPFKKRVKFIRKTESNMLFEKELLLIQLNDDDLILPYFEKGTMYKEMELNKRYTLEELGI